MQLGRYLQIILALTFLLLSQAVLANQPATQQRYIINNTNAIAKPTQRFIHRMVARYHFSKKQLIHWFEQAQYLPDVITHITHPFEKKPWIFYKTYFTKPKRVASGAKYWQEHIPALKKAQKRFGVPPAVIVAIIGIESFYGTIQGDYQELGTLATLAFHYPARAKFFRKELVNYLLLTRQMHLPILKITGSYAGALGIPQFMPSSYRHYAVKFSNSKAIDLLHDHRDAIASVANYLKKSGWKRNLPIVIAVTFSKPVPHQLLSNNAKPNLTVSRLKPYGLHYQGTLPKHIKFALIALTDGDNTDYWLATINLHAIWKYNHSLNYDMSVYYLSQLIKKAYRNSSHAQKIENN